MDGKSLDSLLAHGSRPVLKDWLMSLLGFHEIPRYSYNELSLLCLAHFALLLMTERFLIVSGGKCVLRYTKYLRQNDCQDDP